MSVINRTFLLAASHEPLLRLSLGRHSVSTSSTSFYPSPESQFRRSDFDGQGYTASYEPGKPTEGPIAKASKHGTSRLTPSLLKEHLDKFVVGQDKAKKVTSVAIYNHYQRIREIKRLDKEEQERREQRARRHLHERERNSHPVENEFPGHVESVDLNSSRDMEVEQELGSVALEDNSPAIIEKSNLMLLGPSGVGKTYILQTLAKVLEVPFATVDCSSLTQAGYIGTDIESSIERLLLASSYSLPKCETGIIFFDEVDKLAKPAVMTHGRDVSGEGVQQGLLKMIEGTTVTVNAKSDRSSRTESSKGSDRMDKGGRDGGAGQPGKSEQYTVDTSNILFVFAGAFVGLEKVITSRLSTGSSIGFGAQLRNSTPNPSSSPSTKHPFSKAASAVPDHPLDHVSTQDLQNYGLIPELLGRIPITTSLHPLTLTQLVSILTEPKNSLVKQYTALFNTYSIQLKLTRLALEAIAERALGTGQNANGNGGGLPGGGIGARGLRTIMESVLGEIMFWGPGSAIRFCLVTEDFVRNLPSPNQAYQQQQQHQQQDNSGEKGNLPRCFSRGQGRLFEDAWEKEEEVWREREEETKRRERGELEEIEERAGNFEEYRVVGSSGM